ncbi:hypothetical protein GIS00_16085 [Nakamurella sp. YIM 132087]|uniref:Uncharacterized protein n=1 Tax=Nakamurella alba TaxID=2665158 RepID=A0A7K1FMR2_9ACTN|nr:hypothetical protein [Nakamurella alba]MTD15455.1 hypothetical protein [Nakamurella alba]
MILGYLLAVMGALGSGLGSVVESVAIRRSGAYGGGNDDLGKIARQPLYWTGVCIDILGFVCAALALHLLPLFLVQSVMAFSVGVTATISAILGTRLGRRGWVALAVSATGLVLLGFTAQTGPAKDIPSLWHWLLLAVAPVVGIIGLSGDRVPQRVSAILLGFAAGLGFAAVAVSARSMPDINSVGDLLGTPAAWAIAANGVVATAVFAKALQKGSATTVSAVMFTTNTVVPSAIGLSVLDDSIRSGFLGAGITGFVLAVTGAVALAHYSAVAVEEHERTHPAPAPA